MNEITSGENYCFPCSCLCNNINKKHMTVPAKSNSYINIYDLKLCFPCPYLLIVVVIVLAIGPNWVILLLCWPVHFNSQKVDPSPSHCPGMGGYNWDNPPVVVSTEHSRSPPSKTCAPKMMLIIVVEKKVYMWIVVGPSLAQGWWHIQSYSPD